MRSPTQGIDYTSKDYEAFRTMMLKALGVRMPEYTDMRQSDAGVVILECLAEGLDVISYYQDVFANEVYLVTEEQRENALKWAYMLDYQPRYASPSQLKQVFVLTAVQETDTLIPAWTVLKTVGDAVEPEIYFETVEDLVIPAGALGDEVDDLGNYLYSVAVLQGQSVSGELLGSSAGTPNQSFTLSSMPVIVDDSLLVVVNSGSGFEKWTRVNNFVDSTPTSKHYIVKVSDNDQVTITFGTGVFGQIPPKRQNSIYASYRVGGGTVGNVGARKITVLDSTIGLVAETYNPFVPDIYGLDKETLDEIKTYAPVAYRTQWGALTEEDFGVILKMNFPGYVLFANARRDPTNVDNIYIYVVLIDNNPLTADIEKMFSQLYDPDYGGRMIVGVGEIFFEQATIVPQDLSASLVVQDRFSRAAVEAQVRTFIENFFALGNYEFNQVLSLSELAAQVMNPDNAIEGILSFRFLADEDIITPADNEIFSLGTLTISTTGGVA